MQFSNFTWEIRIPWGLSPLTPPAPPHLCGAKTVGLGRRFVICIFMGFWVVVFAESTAPTSAHLLPPQTGNLAHWRNQRTGQVKAKKTNDLCFCSSSSPQGGCSACHLLMGLGSALPAQPSPSLLESTAWSDPVCQLSSLFSHGSVLTGVSEAGAADVAS